MKKRKQLQTAWLAASIAGMMFAPGLMASDEAPTQIATSCVECHGDGKAAIPGWPPIKYMTREEIITKLTTYRDQLVPGSRMSDVSHEFSDEDIEAIAEYFARRRLQPH